MIGYMLVDSSPGPTQDIMHFQDTGDHDTPEEWPVS